IGLEQLDSALAQFTFIGSPRVWRNTANRLWRYDEVEMPDRYLVVGDAYAAFNPLYGQGLTVASLNADALRIELEEASSLDGLTRKAQARLAKDALFCWGVATGADYRVEGVVGPPPPANAKDRTAFLDRVEALSLEEPEIYLKFWETVQLVCSPEWLEDPALKERIERDWDRLGKLVGVEP